MEGFDDCRVELEGAAHFTGLHQFVLEHHRVLRWHDGTGGLLWLDVEAGIGLLRAEMAGLGSRKRHRGAVENLFERLDVVCRVARRVGVGDVGSDRRLAHGQPLRLPGGEVKEVDGLHGTLRASTHKTRPPVLRGPCAERARGRSRRRHLESWITLLASVTITHLPPRCSIEATRLESGRRDPRWTIHRPVSSSIMARPLATCTILNSVAAAGNGWSPGAGAGSSCTVPVASRSISALGTSLAVSGPLRSAATPPPSRPELLPLPPNLIACTPNCSWLKKMYQGKSAQI